ncbi:Dihydrolipoyllysine-residue acetyltransferase component of pyruvate dehydrogenase complex [Methylobacterium gnaphalii]|uniref:Acetyltransferase component of pyruvate dehydrogenase complex n=1 Tax=Methylobacterium gnaphalii TaxID=1010610 RepID=A0A512JHD1_9HYPH|nr:acetyltransferase component of pyruvate dehydrogenase complex [Methylobacterium gnaphalii]GJD68185.1 Dihydrolipoyllysine-residue acetyltransferase component of pyruvate dehydrogenase complex [Methylobacterium gnaphalii]
MGIEVKVPDIGDFTDIPIIEIFVKEGDTIGPDDPLVSLESDKATMDVPSPQAGVVEKILIKIGDKVSEGAPILLLKGEGEAKPAGGSVAAGGGPAGQGAATPGGPSTASAVQDAAAVAVKQEPAPAAAPAAWAPASNIPDFSNVHASPAVRRIARELGIDLNGVKGTGEKGRITKEDVKGQLTRSAAPAAAGGGAVMASGGMGIPEIPAVDFSKFGPIESKPLARIKKISGPHLHRSWLNVPLVTHSDESDITDTDKYRKELDAAGKEKGYRVTLLAFLIKAAVSALRQHPEFNASLSPDKESLILKKYYNIGVAVDTPDGLVVPVIKDADRKGIVEISQDLGAISKKARDGKLGANDMQGATFSISSLGGIGGTNFTPLVNAPEVAILGVPRSKMQPVWDGTEFRPRLILPLNVSYDHRVIDGALGARFTRHLAHVLEDVRRLVV